MHLQKIYESLGYKQGDLPVAEKVSKEVLSLPIYPELAEDKVELVVREINNFRPLGIPAVEDKVVQMGIKKMLEAIFEVDFQDVSFGFRPSRSSYQVLDVLGKAIMTKPVNHVKVK